MDHIRTGTTQKKIPCLKILPLPTRISRSIWLTQVPMRSLTGWQPHCQTSDQYDHRQIPVPGTTQPGVCISNAKLRFASLSSKTPVPISPVCGSKPVRRPGPQIWRAPGQLQDISLVKFVVRPVPGIRTRIATSG